VGWFVGWFAIARQLPADLQPLALLIDVHRCDEEHCVVQLRSQRRLQAGHRGCQRRDPVPEKGKSVSARFVGWLDCC